MRATITPIAAIVLAAIATLAVALTIGVGAARADQDWRWKYQEWLPAQWQRLIQCETHSNWRHNSGTYQGAFGFYYGTWDTYRLPGYPAEAYNANPFQQWQVAKRVFRHHGYGAWGCFNHGWVRG